MRNVFYINLDKRTKRKESCEKQLKQLEWEFERFPAIKHKNGAIGCALSHLKILEMAKEKKLKYVIVMEDDFIIVNIPKFKETFHNFLNKKPYFDVLKLGGNPFPPYKNITDTYVHLNYSQTTHAYLVFDHYYDTLIQNYKESIFLMNNYGRGPMGIFCCDVWQNVLIHKKNHTWLMLFPLHVTQLSDYSDIEEKVVDYVDYCLDLKTGNKIIRGKMGFSVGTEKQVYTKLSTRKLALLLKNYDNLSNKLTNV